jgi:integrase
VKKNLTLRIVESIKAPDDGARVVVWDSKTPGFGLRVTANGAKTWVAVYRHIGRLRWLTLGMFPTLSLDAARTLAKRALANAQEGGDPASDKQAERAADTWATLCERYLTEDARENCKSRTVKEYTNIIRNVLLPAWGNRKARDVSRADVKSLIGGIRARDAKIMANRTLAMISIIANFGVKEEVLDFNPATRVEKTKEASRDRYLSAEEIRRVWAAFHAERYGAAFKLGLLTGQRPGEVSGMRWSEIDLEAGVWTVPAERAKNRLSHRVPLVGQALTILRGLPREGEHVFPLGLRKSFDHARAASGVDFHAHDLRRTCGTGLAQLHVDRTTIKKVLNHSERGDVTAIYDRHGYDGQKIEALMKWDKRICTILAGPAVVLDLPSAAQTA